MEFLGKPNWQGQKGRQTSLGLVDEFASGGRGGVWSSSVHLCATTERLRFCACQSRSTHACIQSPITSNTSNQSSCLLARPPGWGIRTLHPTHPTLPRGDPLPRLPAGPAPAGFGGSGVGRTSPSHGLAGRAVSSAREGAAANRETAGVPPPPSLPVQGRTTLNKTK